MLAGHAVHKAIRALVTARGRVRARDRGRVGVGVGVEIRVRARVRAISRAMVSERPAYRRRRSRR